MEWYHIPLIPVAILVNSVRTTLAERTTLQYLQNLSPTSCTTNLSTALEPLLDTVELVNQIFAKFATTNSKGERVWLQSSFLTYVAANLSGDQAIITHVPLLWRIFTFSAYYPFSAFELNTDLELDLLAFRRAFALLVLHGFELFGAKQDGRPFSIRRTETKYIEKIPRLTRVVFDCLRTSTMDPMTTKPRDSLGEVARLRHIEDTIYFTQPVTYDSYPYGPSVDAAHFEAAARRLLLMSDSLSTKHESSPDLLSKANLQTFIGLLLCLRSEDRRWRDGLFLHNAYQRSGDVQYARFDSVPDIVSCVPELASNLVSFQLSASGDDISWDQFQAWCSSHSTLIFLFFQLWVSLLMPCPSINPSRPRSGASTTTSLPSSIANLLCMLNVAEIERGVEDRVQHRFHELELQLQLDLQASKLVADLATMPDLNELELHSSIASRDYFHILLIEGEDIEDDAESVEVKRGNRLIAALLSPPMKEMWRDEEGRMLHYTWRSSAVQLQPDITIANCGGMSASVADNVTKLRAHERAASEQETTSIILDMRKKLVSIVGLGGVPMLTLQLVGLKCYRLPGESSRIIRGP